VPFQQRTYEAFVDGNWVNGVADNVVVLNGRNTAIEAKYVDDWVTSLRNPASLEGNRPWAVAEQQKMIDQALKYSRAFDQAIYHTNSPELANHYGPLFRQAGVTNFEFVLTPSSR
jgi:filamentous hemagglutinin